jgi:hypothetical protein
MAEVEKQPVGDAMAFPLLWPTLLRMVRRRFYWLEHARIEDAVADAILRRLQQDSDFPRDVEKESGGVVLRSLYRKACREVGHGIRADNRRGERERAFARGEKIWATEDFFVANELSAGNIGIETRESQWQCLLEDCSAWERTFVELHKEGCRKLTAYVEVLGMERYPLAEQRRAVKRAWDRLRKKLQRQAKRLS